MNCPRCGNTELMERVRDGITVDGCPECRGIWLDRGELERLIQLSRKHDDDDDDHGHREKADKHMHDDGHERGHGMEKILGHDRDHDRDHDDHHGGGWRTADGRRQKPRRWLESLSDLFG